MILWIDLETTGTDPEYDAIIEVGAILTDEDEKLTERGQFHRVYKPDIMMNRLDPHVYIMHRDNGLWWESLRAESFASSEAEMQRIMRWLGNAGAMGNERLILAGSGVAHFDRKFIDQAWPALGKRLTYYTMDIGNVRRLARLGGAAFNYGIEPETKTHRAMDDIEQHLKEARSFIMGVGQLAFGDSRYAYKEPEDATT